MHTTKVDVVTMPIPNDAKVINEANVNSDVVIKNQNIIHAAHNWHKIIVNNCEKVERDTILKIITDTVHPLDLIPVFYQNDGSNVHFLVRNCGESLMKLCRQNLIVQNPKDPKKPFKLVIILGFSTTKELKVNVQDNIVNVLNKRYNSVTKFLNLDNFYKDPDLSEFCMLSQPKILYFVLHLCKNYNLQSLKLTNNEIRLINPIHALCGSNLVSLDLRNNMVENFAELDTLKSMQITELWLDGNPLCENIDEYTYIQGAKEVCPKLEKLDGVPLGSHGFPAFRRNFLCNSSSLGLVDQFVEHYFTLYDSVNRNILEALYHKNALFSLSASYISGQISSNSAQLNVYKRLSRNLKSLADFSRHTQGLYIGSTTIVKVLKELPITEHDPFTFTVDLIHNADKLVILVVGGVFREQSANLLESERMLGFSRQFVLLEGANGELNIINEILNITNATTNQQTRAFKVSKVPRSNYLNLQPAKNEKEQNEMAEALKQITNLNLNWAKKCLEECKYDLKAALKLFVDLYKVDKIPEEAFSVEDVIYVG